MVNLLTNPSFEQNIPNNDESHRCVVFTPNPDAGQDMYITFRGEVSNPVGWQSWYIHDPNRPPAHDPTNNVGWSEPEVRMAGHAGRQHEGAFGHLMFTFYRIHEGGYYQKVKVRKGDTVRASFYAHAWTSSKDDPFTSEWVGSGPHYELEGEPNDQASFWVGIDPYGGTNPMSENVVWGIGAHIYNAFAQVPPVEVEAKNETVTFFTRQRFLWPLKHNDGYIDSAVLERINAPVQPDDMIPAREPYERTYLLLHPSADNAWLQAVIDSGVWESRRITIGGSADDAGIGLRDHRKVIAVKPNDWPSDLKSFFDEWYPGLVYVPVEVDTPDELKVWLVDWLNPTEPPNGGSHSNLKPGLHLTTGDSGASAYYQQLRDTLPNDVTLPSIKAYGTSDVMKTLKLFKDIDPRILTVGRLSQGLDGEEVEGADPSQDPKAEAERLMNISMRAWEPNRDYVDVWEIINEQDPVGVHGHTQMAKFFMHCMDIANENGYTIALFSYSLGVPEWDEIVAIAQTGCLTQAKRDGHYISLHEYAYPMDENFGTPIPGTDPNPERGPLALRYRYWSDAVGGPDQMPNVLLTEVNLARDLATVSDEEWDREMRWYVDKVREDPYVKGVHIFGWGSVGGAWEEFDLLHNNLEDEWYQMVIDYALKDNGEEPPPTHNIIPYSQRDPRWKDEQLGTSSQTIGDSGCALVAACMFASQIDPSTKPDELNQWLTHNNGYAQSNLLRWHKVAEYVPGLKFNDYYVWDANGVDIEKLYQVLDKKPAILKVDFYPGGAINHHFVLALYAQDNDVRIIDPWDGQEKWLLEAYGEPGATIENSVFRMAEYTVTSPPPPINTVIGFNDWKGQTTAADWMRDNNVNGLIVQPVFIGGTARSYDFTGYNHRVIMNPRFSYATADGGEGTIPQPGTEVWKQFVNATAQTINNSEGVFAWEIFNEINNPREWPRGTIVSPRDAIQTYNAIRRKVHPEKRIMCPGAIDPFNAEAGDPRDWLTQIYNGVDGAEIVTAHGYIRGPDSSLVGSHYKFNDNPMTWQYLNYHLCVEALLDSLPSPYKDLPVYITEFNHLWKTTEPEYGWVNDVRAYDVVTAAIAQARIAGYAGLAIYRWSGDVWSVENNTHVQQAVLDAQ